MDGMYPIRLLTKKEYPALLFEIPDPPDTLYLRGELPPPHLTLLAVVGSRNYSNYGYEVVEYLLKGLRGYPLGIISGLAIGTDAHAHKVALDVGLYTLAVPGSGLGDDVLYPRRHHILARDILTSGGGLLSEYEPNFAATEWSFPKRNRIMAGMSHATLVIEASERSGTLITARLTVDYNRELLVVPGSIFSENSKGPHQFLKLGATPITTSDDILEALRIKKGETEANTQRDNTEPHDEGELLVLELLAHPTDRDTLIRSLPLDVMRAQILLSEMELRGHIYEANGIFFLRTS